MHRTGDGELPARNRSEFETSHCRAIARHRTSWPPHVQETPLVFFQNKAGQAAGRIRGSVNSDPIGANSVGDRRRVTVHDKFSVLRVTGKERVSDIQKIIAILAIERHARPYSGMTEEVITDNR